MAALELPVPQGVIIPVDTGNKWMAYTQKGTMPAKINRQKLLTAAVNKTMSTLKQINNKGRIPLVSVRSGARISMPGMMDTVLNIGIHIDNVESWVPYLGERTAWDCLRRFHQMYGEVVLGIDAEVFTKLLNAIKSDCNCEYDSEIPTAFLQRLCQLQIS